MITTDIARICHNVNKAYCESQGDNSRPTWEDAPDWQKDSAYKGVKLHLFNDRSQPEDSHVSWLQQKIDDGWVYGEVESPVNKTHPYLVPFKELPVAQQAKDFIFKAVVDSLKGYIVKFDVIE